MVKHEYIIAALKGFKTVMDKHKIPYWLEFGTLLGAIREQRIIPWDKDGDVGVWIEDIPRMKELEQDFLAEGIIIAYQPGHAFMSIKINDREFVAAVDIYTFKKVKRKGKDWIVRIENGEVFDIHSPAEYFEWFCLVPFLDEMFSVPCEFIEVLEFLYGVWWSKPIEIPQVAYTLDSPTPSELQSFGRSGRKKWSDLE